MAFAEDDIDDFSDGTKFIFYPIYVSQWMKALQPTSFLPALYS